MEKQTAAHILQTLTQGIHPPSGATFPADSPHQHPDTVRALFQALQGLNAPPSSLTTRLPAPANAGKSWTDDEDMTLAERFDGRQVIAELAQEHGRSQAEIPARLVQPGKIEPPSDLPRSRSALPHATHCACPFPFLEAGLACFDQPGDPQWKT